LWPSGKKQAVKIANTRQGYEELLARTGTESNRVCAGFEPTADYHRNIAYWLQQQGVSCHSQFNRWFDSVPRTAWRYAQVLLPGSGL